MTEAQKTIGKEVSIEGIGVHTGLSARVVLKPAPADHGVTFVRTDRPGTSPIPATVDFVSDTGRGTSLASGAGVARTVEHLLAALGGFGVDNLTVEMDGPELPMGDGSALPYSRLLRSAGIRELPEPRRFFPLKAPVYLVEGDGVMVALPADGLRLAFTISFGHARIGSQYLSLAVTPETFEKEIASARTFGFYRDALPLIEKGLIKGSSLDNTVVIGEDAVFSREGLRFPDECVRHKILDLLGDLFLLGGPLKALVLAVKSGHTLNIKFVKKLREVHHE